MGLSGMYCLYPSETIGPFFEAPFADEEWIAGFHDRAIEDGPPEDWEAEFDEADAARR